MTLYASSRVTKPNGDSLQVRHLMPGDLVLGTDVDGSVTTSEVITVNNASMTSNWLNLRTTRHETALGSAHYSLIATSDHQICGSDGTYLPLSDIDVATTLQGVASTLNLDHLQKSILVGILLGDGSVHKGSSAGAGWGLRWSHSIKQEDYMKWTVAALGSLAKIGHEDCSGYGSRMLTARTSHHPDIRELFEDYDKPSGVLSQSIVNFINPVSLAFWYMDDGSLMHSPSQQDRASFATYSFSLSSIEVLRQALLRLGIDSVIQPTQKGPTIRLNYQAARMMFTMVAPLVPPSMQYKLPEDLRGGPGWMPKPHLIPGHRNAALRVLSVTEAVKSSGGGRAVATFRSRGFDVVTSTKNMYVNGMLVRA